MLTKQAILTPDLLSDEAEDQLPDEKYQWSCEAVYKAEAGVRKCREQTGSNSSKEKQRETVRALASLNFCIGQLVAVQRQLKVEQLTIDLTEGWRVAADEEHDEAMGNLDERYNLRSYEKPFLGQPGWLGGWFLGEGAFGRAQLYLRQDDSGNVSNEVVVKDCDFDQDRQSRLHWEYPSLWTTDGRGRSVPTEVKTMIDLRGRQGSEYIVKLLNWRIATERRLYRLYLEVCDL